MLSVTELLTPLSHHMLTLAMGGRLHMAPLEEDKVKVRLVVGIHGELVLTNTIPESHRHRHRNR